MIGVESLAQLLPVRFELHSNMTRFQPSCCMNCPVGGWRPASFTMQCPDREVPLQLSRCFADWTSGTRLPESEIMCAKVPCVDRMESRWDLYPLIWRIQKRRQRCRRRLLKSATSQCERICAWASAFARLPLHSSPLLGWSLGVSLH